MAARGFKSVRHRLHKAAKRRGVHVPRQRALVLPLHTLAGPLEHGQLGVWDEVGVGALLVGCAVAYGIWFYVSGRGEKPPDSK